MSVMRGGVMRSQWGSGVADFKEPASFDSYLWANRPAAAAYTGRIIRVTDVGPAAGSLFISDGTYWVPLNGHLTLFSGAEMGLSTTSIPVAEIAGWSLTIPAGLFKKPGSMIRGIVQGERTGTLGGDGFPTVRVGFGLGGVEYVVAAKAQGTGNKSMRGHGTLARVDAATVRSYRNGGLLGGIPGEDGWEPALLARSADVDMVLKAFGNTASTPGLNETTHVREIILELIVP